MLQPHLLKDVTDYDQILLSFGFIENPATYQRTISLIGKNITTTNTYDITMGV